MDNYPSSMKFFMQVVSDMQLHNEMYSNGQALKEHWKNSKKSEKLRIQGNDLYHNASNALELEEVHKLYSRSIAFAKCHSEELASSYGNRSAVLFRMKKYKECLADIDLAIKIKNSDKFKIKLLCRKIESINLRGEKMNEDILDEVESLISGMTEEANVKEEYKKIYEKSKNVKVTKVDSTVDKDIPIPEHVRIFEEKENENPFDSVSVKWSEENGRYLVANRDFNAGEIVFIEKPYVKVVNLKNSHIYCGHCLASSWATLPCDYCNWCMFCSEECKKTSWEQYHSTECPIVSQIENDKDRGGISHFEQISIRALILGIKDAGSIQNLKSQIKGPEICTESATEFQSLYSLDDKVALGDLYYYIKKSSFILMCLMKLTTLFGTRMEYNVENLMKNNEVSFIALTIYKLLKVVNKNCHQLPGEDSHNCKYSNSPETCSSTNCCNRGFAVMTIGSLIKHNCHPQLTNVINKQSQFIVCSLRPIKKDSQIFLCYGGMSYFDMPKFDRIRILLSRFHSICACEACEKNWPTMEELQKTSKVDAIVRPFIKDSKNARCTTLSIIQCLSKTVSKAHVDYNHPSIVLIKLEKGMEDAIKNLYENCGTQKE